MDDFCWWRDGVIYQIYPRSFMDSNHDGFGDLPGIQSRLDYIQHLEVDAIWLSPVYPSPDADFGYDVSHYLDIDPRYGSLQDFDNLVDAAHQRNIRIIMDLVLNHTSDQHEWFKQSRSSRDNPYRDWYIWRPARQDGSLPNNWLSVFGGSGWQYDPQSGEYYFHMFAKEQPDLNWRNPAVRAAMVDVFRFWLDRGVDGFRLDVFNGYFKDAELKDNPYGNPGIRAFERQKHVHDCDQPEMFPLLQEVRSLLEKYDNRYLVGETFLSTPQKAARYTGPDLLHAAFNFEFNEQPARAARFADAIDRWEGLYSGSLWPNYVLENHDIPRTATRYNFDRNPRYAKLLATLLLTLRGTPFLYYGQEIGMRDVSLKRDEIMDPPGKKYWPLFKGRDGCRSPMQWDDNQYGGFSTSRPWLKVHPGYIQTNVARQDADHGSLFNYYRQLLRLRKQYPALMRGDYRRIDTGNANILVYERSLPEQRLIILQNFSRGAARCRLREYTGSGRVILSSHVGVMPEYRLDEGLLLLPGQAIVLEVVKM